MQSPTPIKIRIDTEDFWFLPDSAEDPRTGPVCPLSHCHDDGTIRDDALGELTFAHCFNGAVMQFGHFIGHLDDFVAAAAAAAEAAQ